MDITTDADLDAKTVMDLRKARGESLATFWARVGITASGGWRYESGVPIPRYVRIPLFAIYVAGLEMDSSTPDGAEALRRLASLQHSDGAEAKAAKLQEAAWHLSEAGQLLKSV